MQNLFKIEPTNGKRQVFMSAVAERFRDFKSKLVSGWITKTRKRTKKEVDKMPYEVYPHISCHDWEAFVAQKTTPEQVVRTPLLYVPCYVGICSYFYST